MTCVFTYEGREFVGEDAFKAHLRSLPEKTVRQYMPHAGAASRTPDMPFKNNGWAALALKRMVRFAATEGFDQIAWTRGQHQIERFSLEKHIDAVQVVDWPAAGEDMVVLAAHKGDATVIKETIRRDQVKDYIGADVAERLLSQPKDRVTGARELSGLDLKTGGEGMRAFYDRILPNIANDLGKKYGARVGETEISAPENPGKQFFVRPSGSRWEIVNKETGLRVTDQTFKSGADSERWLRDQGLVRNTETVHSLPLTPAMREGVLGAPMDAFARADNGKAPDLSEFIDTLVADLRGDRQVYSVKDQGALKNAQDLTDARAWFEDNGIDLSASKEDIRAAVLAVLDARKDETAPAYHPDEIAQWFGFSSGDEMLKAIAALKPRAVAIEQRMDEITQEELGDPMNDGTMQKEAQDAAHEETQARKIEIELAALEVASGGRKSALARHAKIWAQEQIEAASVRDIRHYDLFLAGERRAAKQAFDAAAKGDMQAAALAKARQLMSFWLYHYARKADAHLTKMQNQQKRYNASATTRAAIGPRHFEQIDAILDSIETGKPSFKPSQSLSEWAVDIQTRDGIDPEEDLGFDPDVIEATIKRRWADMSYIEAQAVHAAIKNIEQIGRGVIRAGKNREAQRVADIVEALKNRLTQEWTGRIGKRKSLASPTRVDKFFDEIAEFDAGLLKADFLARGLDGFQDGGPFMTLFGYDAQHAQTDLYERETQATTQLRAIIDAHYSPKQFAQMLEKKLFVPLLQDSRTKAQLIGYALNRGTRYNFEALLNGENKSKDHAFTWTESNFWEIVGQLDRNDWKFVQALWKYVEQWKEESFALEERVRGVRPTEVIGERFQLPDGTIIDGAYWPVMFDPKRSAKAAARQAQTQTLAEHGATFVQPATNRGRNISRKGTGGQVLSSDFMAVLGKHVKDTLIDLSHRELVLLVRRVKADKELRSMIEKVKGPHAVEALDKWAARVARKQELRAFGDAGNVPVKLRRSYTNYALMFKGTVSLLNLLGHFTGIQRNGFVSQMKQSALTMGPGFADLVRRHMLAMLGGTYFTKNGIEASGRLAFVRSKSGHMRQFTDGHFDRDINDIEDTLTGKVKGTILPAVAARFGQYLNHYTNQIVGVPLWMAAYENAMAGKVKGIAANNEPVAIDHADSVVRMSVAAGDPKDLSAFSANNEAWRRFVFLFRNWADIFYNQIYAEQYPGVASGKISKTQFAANMFWLVVAPSLVSMLVYGQADKKDDEDDAGYLLRLALNVFLYGFTPIPIAGEVLSSLVLGYNPKTPIQAISEKTKRSIDAAFRGDSDAAVKSAVQAGAMVTGVPQQLITTGDYAVDLAQGKEDPGADPADAFSEALLRDTR